MCSNYKIINGFDIDGVISVGIHPGPDDVIITGRSYEEEPETMKMLADRGIKNKVFMNNKTFDQKTRETSGIHKANIIQMINDGLLLINGIYCKITIFFEDDPIQIAEINKIHSSEVTVVEVKHNLTEKENVRHASD